MQIMRAFAYPSLASRRRHPPSPAQHSSNINNTDILLCGTGMAVQLNKNKMKTIQDSLRINSNAAADAHHHPTTP